MEGRRERLGPPGANGANCFSSRDRGPAALLPGDVERSCDKTLDRERDRVLWGDLLEDRLRDAGPVPSEVLWAVTDMSKYQALPSFVWLEQPT